MIFFSILWHYVFPIVCVQSKLVVLAMRRELHNESLELCVVPASANFGWSVQANVLVYARAVIYVFLCCSSSFLLSHAQATKPHTTHLFYWSSTNEMLLSSLCRTVTQATIPNVCFGRTLEEFHMSCSYKRNLYSVYTLITHIRT